MISEKLSTDSRRMLQNGVPQFVGFCRCTSCRQRRGKVPSVLWTLPALRRCTSCRQRRGKGVPSVIRPHTAGCTSCRQRRGKGQSGYRPYLYVPDAPRAGSAEAKGSESIFPHLDSDAPRAGSAEAKFFVFVFFFSGFDAPRAGSAEAKPP